MENLLHCYTSLPLAGLRMHHVGFLSKTHSKCQFKTFVAIIIILIIITIIIIIIILVSWTFRCVLIFVRVVVLTLKCALN